MRSVVAAAVIPSELISALEDDKWDIEQYDPNHIKASKLLKSQRTGISHGIYINLDAKVLETLYDVKIYSEEDPSDSEQESTGEPLKFIEEFLRQGLPKDIKFSNLMPEHLILILNKLANVLEFPSISTINHRKRLVSTALRRIAAYINIDKLRKNLEKRWKVDKVGDKLTINIEDIYTVEIALDTILWRVNYSVPKLDIEVSSIDTDDPIDIFFDVYKDPEFRKRFDDFYKQKQLEEGETIQEIGEEKDTVKDVVEQEKATVKPGKSTS